MDLSNVPTEDLLAELKSRGRYQMGRPVTVEPCPRCGKQVTATQKRFSCERNHEPPPDWKTEQIRKRRRGEE